MPKINEPETSKKVSENSKLVELADQIKDLSDTVDQIQKQINCIKIKRDRNREKSYPLTVKYKNKNLTSTRRLKSSNSNKKTNADFSRAEGTSFSKKRISIDKNAPKEVSANKKNQNVKKSNLKPSKIEHSKSEQSLDEDSSETLDFSGSEASDDCSDDDEEDEFPKATRCYKSVQTNSNKMKRRYKQFCDEEKNDKIKQANNALIRQNKSACRNCPYFEDSKQKSWENAPKKKKSSKHTSFKEKLTSLVDRKAKKKKLDYEIFCRKYKS